MNKVDEMERAKREADWMLRGRLAHAADPRPGFTDRAFSPDHVHFSQRRQERQEREGNKG